MVNRKLAYYFCGNRIVQQLCPSVPEKVQCHTTEGTSSRLYPLHCHHWILFQSIFQLKQSFQPVSELFKHKYIHVSVYTCTCMCIVYCVSKQFNIFHIDFGSNTIVYSFSDSFFIIDCNWLPRFSQKLGVFPKPAKSVMSSNMERLKTLRNRDSSKSR